MQQIALIFIGGGIGSLLRYFLSKYVQQFFAPTFPTGTLAVNIVASLILGLFLGKSFTNQDAARAFVAIGICGGFSTFSTFSNDTLQLILSNKLAEAGLNILLNVILCILATYIGILIAR
jgi:fluoride exporter